jgi:hypothetical protein
MNISELCSLHRSSWSSPTSRVPRWVLGCFRRRSITFFNGDTDDSTLVIWIQSQGLTADLRLAEGRPRPEAPEQLRELSSAELIAMAQVEGGIAPSRFEPDAVSSNVQLSGVMHWLDWNAFQIHAKWPEPGELRRVGDCLIEFAPSGAYVEDWRLQPSEDGPLLGLSLVDERERKTGALRHRGGGLVIAGEHALFVRGRAATLPQAERLSALIARAAREPELLSAIFGFEASYARRRGDGDYVIQASTWPWREGEVLVQDGFSVQDGLVLQQVSERGDRVERRYRVDTLEPSYEDWVATPATGAAVSWLNAESSTLLRSAKR